MSHHRHADAIDADRRARSRIPKADPTRTAEEAEAHHERAIDNTIDALRRREYALAAIRGQAFIADPIGATAINALVDYAALHYADAGFPNGATLGGLVAWAHARINEMSPP